MRQKNGRRKEMEGEGDWERGRKGKEGGRGREKKGEKKEEKMNFKFFLFL